MKVGIIGGSGLYNMEAITEVSKRRLETPFGAPSDEYVCGRLGGVEVCFLPRHGVGHRLLPTEINHRANIYGFKLLGVERVVSISAVGSLKEAAAPRDVVLPDQYFDRTKASLTHTFFGQGVVAHVPFGEPVCSEMRGILAHLSRELLSGAGEKRKVHEGGTYVNMEGPAFSTKAESAYYRSHGFDIIGMTSLGEAKLCREAELCYQSVSLVTDYDCWRESEESVTVEMVVGNMKANTEFAKQLLVRAVPELARRRGCACGSSLHTALMTDKAALPPEAKARLGALIGRYL